VFSSIKTILLKTLISPIRYFKTVINKEDSTLLTITNNVFHFINLHKKDVSVICDFKR